MKFQAQNRKTFQANVEISTQKAPNDRNYSNRLLKITHNICKFTNGYLGNLFERPVVEAVQKHTNFTLKCPVKKSTFYIRDLEFGSYVFPIKDYKFHYDEKLYASVNNEKKKRFICKFDIYGIYKNG